MSIFSSGSLRETLLEFLYVVPAVLIALTFHEFAHGYVAMRLGDPTARNQGRLTLNPLKHLDPIGAVCMLFFHFGWAKPVPVNSRYFKKPRRDMALVAAAGPAMNVLLALLGALLFRILSGIASLVLTSTSAPGYTLWMAALSLLYYFHLLNLSLGVFNLIPVPPLDGSRILYIFLPPKIYWGVMKYERYIQIALMLLLWLGLLSTPLSHAVSAISNGMFWLVDLIPFPG